MLSLVAQGFEIVGFKTGHLWKDKLPSVDSLVPDPENSDIIIGLMGAVGCGKSTFINTLFGKEVAPVGHELQARTTQIKHYIFHHPEHPERRIVVVEVPGLDSVESSDIDILRRVSTWLAQSYTEGMKLTGLIYLQDITQRRMMGSVKINYEVFENLCGKEGAGKVVLATTMWDEVRPELGAEREKELREKFWGSMFSKGSTIHRVEPTQKSALEIVDSVLVHDLAHPTQTPSQMVKKQEQHTEAEAVCRQGATEKPKRSGSFARMFKSLFRFT